MKRILEKNKQAIPLKITGFIVYARTASGFSLRKILTRLIRDLISFNIFMFVLENSTVK